MFDFMPAQVGEWAPRVDFINNLINYLSLFFTVLLTGLSVYFAIRYRRTETNREGADIRDNHTLETVLVAIPSVVCLFFFAYGFMVYKDMRTPPANAKEIYVEGYKWGWEFMYSTGKKSGSELVVPLGEPVKLVLKSRDVLHSFYIPSVRVKEDVVPSQYNYLWFRPMKLGEYHIFCAEYCGLKHSGMLATLKVVEPEEYQDYISNRGEVDLSALSPAQAGEKLYKEKACFTCHSISGEKIVGPSFKGLFGAKREFEAGQSLTADENYIRESILNPNAKIVKGFVPQMPPYEGQLSDEELNYLIAFIKEQK